MHVLIAGAGVGGLCLANGLRAAGVRVSVFERDHDLAVRNQGYRIHIDEDGGAALRHCLPENLYRLYLGHLGGARRRPDQHPGHRPGGAVRVRGRTRW